MNRERLPAKICEVEFMETSLPVDMYAQSPPTSKLLPWGLTGSHFVVRYCIYNENSFSYPYFAVSPKDRLAD